MSKKKKIILIGCIVILILLILILYFDNSSPNNKIEPLTLKEEGKIPLEQCSERNLTDKIIILESASCSACRIAVPRLQEVEDELNLSFIFIDISKDEDLKKMDEFAILPFYTPTIIVGCDIYIGLKSKEEYKRIIQNFLAR